MDEDRLQRPHLSSALCYRDPMPMLDWLQRAYGFELSMLITDAEGRLAHSQMTWGDSRIMVGNEWSENHASPASLGRKNTQTVHVQLAPDAALGLDAHCARARAAGAEVIQEPEDQFYGDRTYRARDPEGHIWTFGQTVRQVAPEDWDGDSGLKTTIYS